MKKTPTGSAPNASQRITNQIGELLLPGFGDKTLYVMQRGIFNARAKMTIKDQT